MTRFFRLLIGLPVLACDILIGLYGLLALFYRDEGGGSTYVTLFGHQMNAHFVGVAALLIALAVIVVIRVVYAAAQLAFRQALLVVALCYCHW